MNSPSPVIVTCPHCCDASIDPSCDALSGAIANRVVENMNGTAFFNRDVLRSDLDMNRPESRFHPWRVGVRKKVREIVDSGKKPFVLDIHTYSDRDLDDRTKAWKKYDAVTLVHPFNDDERTVLEYLDASFKKHGLKMGFAAGQPCTRRSGTSDCCNDIVSVSEFLGASAILMEFNQASLKKEGYLEKMDDVFDDDFFTASRFQ